MKTFIRFFKDINDIVLRDCQMHYF